ncbi:MAG: 16S rRNA (guanine(966)-N(2))-methyltransferase RsmD, partial [Armatimonadetes bacterium]
MAKGRTIRTPPKGTRPMTGRARESVFSILANRLPGARVLDLFAGSGSLGLESLSRGAERAVFVENSRSAAAIIASNIEAVGLGGTVVRVT